LPLDLLHQRQAQSHSAQERAGAGCFSCGKAMTVPSARLTSLVYPADRAACDSRRMHVRSVLNATDSRADPVRPASAGEAFRARMGRRATQGPGSLPGSAVFADGADQGCAGRR
jgi:hypothetical protein